MNLKLTHIGGLACVLVAAALSLWARTHLPDAPIATHFDLQGQANGYMPRDKALAFGPGLVLVVWLILELLPVLSPKKASLERSGTAYGMVTIAVLLFILLVHAVIVFGALGGPQASFDHMRLLYGAIGVLFIVIGNFLPKTRYNYFMGIRTPWTLSDERVWDRTHRFAGPLTMVGGLAVVIAAFVAPETALMAIMITCTIIPSLISIVYSWAMARRLKLV